MPIDQSTQPAAGTTRRTFLVRSALGGALVTAGAVASQSLGLTGAGAQASDDDLLTDSDFAAFAAPFELTAVIAYQQALATELLDVDWTSWARQFQTNHQATFDLLASLLDEDLPSPVVDADLSSQVSAALSAAGDQTAILQELARIEETLAATHLSAVPLMREKSTSRAIAQVVATESQQAVLLGIDSGATLEELTPPASTTDLAIAIESSEAPTTTTTAAESTTTAAAGN